MALLKEGNNLFSKSVGLICNKKDLGQVLDNKKKWSKQRYCMKGQWGPLEDIKNLLDKHLSERANVQLILPWDRMWII